MSSIRWFLVGVLLWPAIAFSQSTPSPANWLDDLTLGGYVIVLRHGATTSDQADADPMSKPAKNQNAPGERQLSDQGRTQAKAIGAAMRRLKIPVGLVMTSPLQRAVDTGTLLGFGEVTTSLDLAESGSSVSPQENTRRAESLRKLVASQSPVDNNLVIVTHKPNLSDAFGEGWSDVHEGEASVFESDNAGGYKLIARIRADEWRAMLEN